MNVVSMVINVSFGGPGGDSGEVKITTPGPDGSEVSELFAVVGPGEVAEYPVNVFNGTSLDATVSLQVGVASDEAVVARIDGDPLVFLAPGETKSRFLFVSVPAEVDPAKGARISVSA